MRTIAVVDGNSLIHRAFHALPPSMVAPDGRPTNAAFGFMSMFVKLVQDLGPDGVIVAFDKGKPAFRTEALEQYKVHRPPTDPDLKAQFPMVQDLLRALDVPIVQLEGWEGDDILGTIARLGEEQGMRVLLVTGDRDAFQLVSDAVQVVTTKKGISDIVVYGPNEVLERYGVTAEQVPDYLGLKGDTSDNIPGVPGIGEKTAAKLLQQYATLDALLEQADDIKGKVGESLRENADAARASRTVATISRDVPIDIDLAAVEFGGFDPGAVAEAFGALRFTSLRDRVLALHGDGAVVEAAVASSAAALAEQVEGDAAQAAVTRWIDDAALVGVAFDEGGDTLFADARDLAVAGPDAVAIVAASQAHETLASLFESAHVAAPDAKALLQELCPADESEACALDPARVAPQHIRDVAVAAYLLESNRSSYDVDGLYADYLDASMPEPAEGGCAAAATAQATRELAEALAERLAADDSLGVFDDIEMPLVPVLARMERTGVGVDVAVLASLSEETSGRIDALRAHIWELAGREFTVDSPKQLAEVLFDDLALPPQKKTKTGYSTDASVLAALEPLHPIAPAIVEYRELTKLRSTYIDALPKMLAGDGRLHTSFNQTVAATGRLSSSNPNLQNIPVRTEFGRRIRAAFVPANAGDLMVSADYSQIELRILAHLSGDAGLIEAFTSGADFHQATAARVFGVAPDDVPTELRARAKAVNFGIVYGQTAHGLAASLGITHPEAQAMIDAYYAAYPRVREYLDETVAAAHRDGYAVTMFGRKRRIPELKSSNYNLRAFGERTAMNHPMQGSAADIMKLAMIDVDRELRESGLESRLVLQVHDELVFEAPPAEIDALGALASGAMAGVAELAVPLEVSVNSGRDWASAK